MEPPQSKGRSVNGLIIGDCRKPVVWRQPTDARRPGRHVVCRPGQELWRPVRGLFQHRQGLVTAFGFQHRVAQAGELQPHHATYFGVILHQQRQRPLAPAGEPLVLSPIVIAMWRPMAEALGWPRESGRWQIGEWRRNNAPDGIPWQQIKDEFMRDERARLAQLSGSRSRTRIG